MLDQDLRNGLLIPDRTGRQIQYRYLSPGDDLEAITTMLHEAYARLAEAGMRFFASHQDKSATQRRVSRGETIVALDGDRIVGIVTLADAAATCGTPFYDRPNVASFGQFAVHPIHQGLGIGSRLLEMVEARASEKGLRELALDTSERATELIAMYRAKGFRFIEYAQWKDTNYRSVILAKRVSQLTTQHCAAPAAAGATSVAHGRPGEGPT